MYSVYTLLCTYCLLIISIAIGDILHHYILTNKHPLSFLDVQYGVLREYRVQSTVKEQRRRRFRAEVALGSRRSDWRENAK